MIRFLDLFAGAGGLSEGFIQAGYSPVAHVEMDAAACNTLRTRTAYYWLKNHSKQNVYNDYLDGKLSRDEFYKAVPQNELNNVIEAKISDETIDDIFSLIDNKLGDNKLNLIVGGPPCQAYSLVGRARDKNNMKDDDRNYLYRYYIRFLVHYKPEFFVFENVVGLLSAKDNDGVKHLQRMLDAFHDVGYLAAYKVIQAKKYGVPQNRQRIILVGKYIGRENVKIFQSNLLTNEGDDFYPVLVSRPDLDKYTIKDLFQDLPAVPAGGGTTKLTATDESKASAYLKELHIQDHPGQSVTFHVARPNNEQDLKIYQIVVNEWNKNHERLKYTDLPDGLQSHKNKKAFLDRFKVVAGDEHCAQTICAHLAKDGHYYIHPDINQNRSITPREAARIQTFPDDYYFESISGRPSRTFAYKQIGNAVPVYLAYCIAEAMKDNFKRTEAKQIAD